MVCTSVSSKSKRAGKQQLHVNVIRINNQYLPEKCASAKNKNFSHVVQMFWGELDSSQLKVRFPKTNLQAIN